MECNGRLKFAGSTIGNGHLYVRLRLSMDGRLCD